MPVSRDEIILDKSEYSPLDNHLSYYTKQAIVPFFVENGIFRGGGWGWRILVINFVRNFKFRVNILKEVNYYQISQILLKMTMENIALILYLQRSFFSIVHFTNLCSVII